MAGIGIGGSKIIRIRPKSIWRATTSVNTEHSIGARIRQPTTAYWESNLNLRRELANYHGAQTSRLALFRASISSWRAWVGIRVPLWPSRAIPPGSLLTLRYLLRLPLVFIRRCIGSSICQGSKREPFRTRIYCFFQMS